jgi:hypothetical protein
MTSFLSRGWSPGTPCPEYAKFQQIAEELVANISEPASPEQCEQVQQSLLFLFHELKEQLDPWHPRVPGGHPCLEHCYLQYAMRIRNRALRYKPLPPPGPPVRRQPQRSADEVVNDVSSLADEVKRPGDTYLGEER